VLKQRHGGFRRTRTATNAGYRLEHKETSQQAGQYTHEKKVDVAGSSPTQQLLKKTGLASKKSVSVRALKSKHKAIYWNFDSKNKVR
jgi:hypothetical protein